MTTLALLASGPLQSWGVRSASPRRRDTLRHPSRSGVIGLLAACQGKQRTESLTWADDLEINVRIDQPGRVLSDFHTAGGGLPRAEQMRTGAGKQRADAEVTSRDYLADATFVISVTGSSSLIDTLGGAVRRPVFSPFLGRKSCPPGLPLFIGITNDEPLTLLGRLPAYGAATPRESLFDVDPTREMPASRVHLRVMTENPEFAETTVNDRPESFDHWRRAWTPRAVGETTVAVPVAGQSVTGLNAMRIELAREAS